MAWLVSIGLLHEEPTGQVNVKRVLIAQLSESRQQARPNQVSGSLGECAPETTACLYADQRNSPDACCCLHLKKMLNLFLTGETD